MGQREPRKDEPGYDVALQARSGIMGITGEPDSSPVKVGVAWIDVITGLNAAIQYDTLLHKEKTGEAMSIDISLWDCAIAALVNQAHNAIASGVNPIPMGSSHPNLVPYRAFEASDGWFVIGVGSDRQWNNLADLLLEQSKRMGVKRRASLAPAEVEECYLCGFLRTRSELEQMSLTLAPQSTQCWKRYPILKVLLEERLHRTKASMF